jgi:hypothetical protein
MKKLLIISILINVVNFILLVTICNENVFVGDEFCLVNECDTVISKVRIDSIEYVIKTKDSIINNIKYELQEDIKKVDSFDNDANVELFKQLVSE